jgi:hypothetical protein
MSARDDYPDLARQADEGGCFTVTEASLALDEIDRLRAALDEAQLSDIAARNPGIDIDKVRAHRASLNTERIN